MEDAGDGVRGRPLANVNLPVGLSLAKVITINICGEWLDDLRRNIYGKFWHAAWRFANLECKSVNGELHAGNCKPPDV
jgi:hypothetical protein